MSRSVGGTMVCLQSTGVLDSGVSGSRGGWLWARLMTELSCRDDTVM